MELVLLAQLVHLVFVFIFFHFSSKQVSGNELRTFETDELLLVVSLGNFSKKFLLIGRSKPIINLFLLRKDKNSFLELWM